MKIGIITRLRVVGFLFLGLVLMGLVGGLSSYHYINKRLNSHADAIIAKLNHELEVQSFFQKVGYDFYHKPYVSNVKLIQKNAYGFLPQIDIPKMTFDYEVSFDPKPHVTITQINVHQPKVSVTQVNSLTSDLNESKTNVSIWEHLFERVPLLNESLSHNMVGLAPNMKIVWDDLEVVYESDKIKKHATGLSGQGDFLNGSYIDVLFMQKQNEVQRVHIKIQKKAKGIVVSLNTNKLLLDVFKNYLPDEVVLTKNSFVSGDVAFSNFVNQFPQDYEFDLKVYDVGVKHWRLSDLPIDGVDFAIKGNFSWDKFNKKISNVNVNLFKNEVDLNITGSFDYGDHKQVRSRFVLENVPIQKIIKAIPFDFIPIVNDAVVAGSLGFDVMFELDLENPNSLKFEPNITINDYALIQAPFKADLFSLKESFTHKVVINESKSKEFLVGPKNRKFVSYRRLGKKTIKGVLTCEDGRFFMHNGFQLKHIKKSIIQNLKEKRFARGASTITMQLAKNLFLSGKKNISRKFQEMLIAYALEQEYDKKRLLEIYMNIIEWGPEIYGIGHASQHYFKKSPAHLTVLEAAYLGSIIANPKKYYYMYKRGEVTNTWSNYLRVIVSKMHMSDNEEDGEYVFGEETYKPEFGWVRKKRELSQL